MAGSAYAGDVELTVITCPYPGQSFTVKPGDVLIVRLPPNEPIDVARASLEALLSFLQDHEIGNVQVIAMPACGRVDCLDEEAMSEIGWVRG